MPRLAFDHRFFAHVNAAARAERGRASRLLERAEAALGKPWVVALLSGMERVASILLNLPIPIYAGLVRRWVRYAPGLPAMGGMYLRALYWRPRLGKLDANVLIDEGVIFGHPKGVFLSEFCYIDKRVMLISRRTEIGRRVHVAPGVFVSGGGDFVAEDFSGVAAHATLITSTEVLKDGARCSGPMVEADQRKVHRGTVRLGKDAFIGAAATLLPDVEVGQGSVIGAGVTLARSTAPWSVHVAPRSVELRPREPVRHPDT